MTNSLHDTQYDKNMRSIRHTSFGGYVFPSDFNTDNRGKDDPKGSPLARRIASDQRFDEQCAKNISFRIH